MRCSPELLLPLITLVAGVTALAQGPGYHLGRAASEAEIKAWDTAVGPAGKELPPGSGTAREGAQIFKEKCASCHGQNAEKGGRFAVLVGGKGTLQDVKPVKSIGSYYPFATTVWDYIYRNMPPQQERSLPADEVYAVTAFLLYKNDIIKEDEVINAESLPKIRMPNRDGFIPPWPPEYKPRQKRPFGIYP